MQAIQGVGSVEVADLRGEFRSSHGSLSEEVHILAERVSKAEGAAVSTSNAVKENTEKTSNSFEGSWINGDSQVH